VYKFRKKPVVIEAFQMTVERRWHNDEWPNWLHEAWQKDKGDAGAYWCDKTQTDRTFITTLEGVHEVSPGDFIIQGVKGELYPCKPDIFETTYDPVKPVCGSE